MERRAAAEYGQARDASSCITKNVKPAELVRATMPPRASLMARKKRRCRCSCWHKYWAKAKPARLYQALVVEQKLASGVDVGTSYDGFTLGPAQLEISAVPDAGTGRRSGNAGTSASIRNWRASSNEADSKPDAELARAKTLLKAESVYARDGLTGMARIMGWIRMDGLDKDYFTRWPQLIDAITRRAGQRRGERYAAGQPVGDRAALLPEEAPRLKSRTETDARRQQLKGAQ